MSIQIKKHIPNAVTCLNLLAGCFAIVADLSWHKPELALLAILAATVFDLFDGMLARALKLTSNIGADLDSLADVVSFGLAPSVHLFSCLIAQGYSDLYAFPAFLIAAFAAIRLAKFNNDTRQSESFIGLPVPANALFWISYVYLMQNNVLDLQWGILLISYAFVGLLSYLMVSEISMLSFKVHSVAWRGNEYRYILLLVSLLFLILWRWGGFAPAILLYVALGLLQRRQKSLQTGGE